MTASFKTQLYNYNTNQNSKQKFLNFRISYQYNIQNCTLLIGYHQIQPGYQVRLVAAITARLSYLTFSNIKGKPLWCMNLRKLLLQLQKELQLLFGISVDPGGYSQLLVVAVILGVPFHQFPINFFGLAELVAFDQVNTLNERTKREPSRYQPSALTAKHTPRQKLVF